MPRRNSNQVSPIRVGGKAAISLDRVSNKRLEPIPAEARMEFDWDGLFSALGLRAEEREYLKRKHLGYRQAANTESVRARVSRRLKKARSAGIKRSDYEVPVRGGDSRHLVYSESLPSGRKVFTLSRLGATFAAVMGDELQNIFVDSRTTPPSLRGSSRSTEIVQHSTVTLQIKSLDEQGTFLGDLAVYSNLDDGNDIIQPGAFSKTLRENNGVVPLFLNHSADDIRQKIGALYLEDSTRALRAKGILNLELPAAQEARSIMRFDLQHNLRTAMSIGYRAVVAQAKDGARLLKEIRLFEGSLVGLGMNSQAVVTSAKNAKDARDAQLALLLKQLKDAYTWLPSRPTR